MRPEYTEDYKGYTINIYHDGDYSQNNDFDDSVFMVAYHTQFTINHPTFTKDRVVELFQSKSHEEYYLFPLRAYIHSGVSLSLSNTEYPFNDRFDSSWVGLVFVDKNKAGSEEVARDIAEGLITTHNHLLSGEVYGYTITKDGDETDACWGFIGEYTYCLNEAKEVVDYMVNNE